MTRSTVGRRDLAALFSPASVAVAGASTQPGKWGYRIAEQLARHADRRSGWFVNRKGGELLGAPVYPALADLPEAPELVAVCVPNRFVEETVEEGLAIGARAFIVLAAGFGELGGEGLERERRLVERVRAEGGLLLGPNCLGVCDLGAGFECMPWTNVSEGGVGFITQSGSLVMDLDGRFRQLGLGFSRVAAVGNQADVTISELIRDYARHEETRCIAVYCEDLRDGRKWFAAAGEAVAAGCPVVLLSPAESSAAAQAAHSHTGALVSDRAAVEAACRASGVMLVETPRELLAATQMAMFSPPRATRRVALVSEGGGFNVFAAGQLQAHGLELPPLADELRNGINELEPDAVPANPVDLVGVVSSEGVARVVDLIAGSEDLDAVMTTAIDFTLIDERVELGVADALADALEGRKAGAVVVYDLDAVGVHRLRERGVPVYRDADDAAFGLAAVLGRERPAGIPALPAAVAVPDDAEGYFGARALLADAGIPFAAAEQVAGLEEALAAAERLGYPVVLKAMGLLHKSDAGGVALGLVDADALCAAYADMDARLTAPVYSVEQMVRVADGVELIVGSKRDPRIGPLVLVGFGGVYSEILRDTAVELAPVDEEGALRLLRSLRAAAILEGARGKAPVDLRAAARAVAALSRVAAAHPDVAEVEVNPLLVGAEGAVALDARVVLGGGPPPEEAI